MHFEYWAHIYESTKEDNLHKFCSEKVITLKNHLTEGEDRGLLRNVGK